MFKKIYPFYFLSIFLFIVSCSSTSDTDQKISKITEALRNSNDINKRVDIFYPKEFNKDNTKGIINQHKDIVDQLTKNTPEKIQVSIANESSKIKIRNRYFKLVNVTETTTLDKKEYQSNSENLKSYLADNLIDYIESDTHLNNIYRCRILTTHE